MKAVILVGGPGMRLRPLTNDRPKSIVPVLNRPVLEHTLAYLKHYGIRDIILTLSYLPDVIKGYFGDGKRFGVNLAYCIEEEPRGTAGAVKNAESHLDGSFFVLNGDVFTDMDLAQMLEEHRRKKAQATIALTWVENTSAFGVVETNETGRVQRFIEKPPPGTTETHWINAGTYILEREILNVIPPGCHYMFERGLFPQLLETGKAVYGHPYRGYWLDMGNPGNYYSINMDMLNRKTSNFLQAGNGNKPIYNKKKVSVHKTAVIKAPAMIADGCNIGAGVKIKGGVIIGKDCFLDEGTEIENSIIWDGVTIGARTQIKGCIISNGTIIPDEQILGNNIITPGQTAPLVK